MSDDTSLFVSDICDCEILPREEQLDCVRQIRAGEAAADKLQRARSPQSIARLTRAVDAGNAGRAALVESVLPMVVRIVKQHRLAGVGFDEAVSDGYLGLMNAIAKFDPERGNAFATYAWLAIARAVHRGIAVRARHGRHYRRSAALEVSDDGRSAAETERQLDLQAWAARLDAALEELPERRRIVLQMRAGGRTIDEVGGVLGVSRERVRQIEYDGLQMLRAHFGGGDPAGSIGGMRRRSR